MAVMAVRAVASFFRATASIGHSSTSNISATSLLRMARMVMAHALQVLTPRTSSSPFPSVLLQSAYSPTRRLARHIPRLLVRLRSMASSSYCSRVAVAVLATGTSAQQQTRLHAMHNPVRRARRVHSSSSSRCLPT